VQAAKDPTADLMPCPACRQEISKYHIDIEVHFKLYHQELREALIAHGAWREYKPKPKLPRDPPDPSDTARTGRSHISNCAFLKNRICRIRGYQCFQYYMFNEYDCPVALNNSLREEAR
jgi:hypothetical protein